MAPDATLDDLAARAAAAEKACDWDAAVARFGELFDRSVRAGAAERLPAALMGIARALSPDAATEEAEELAWLAHEIALRLGRHRDAASALNVAGTVLHRRNDPDGAAALYTRALRSARDLGDDTLIAMTCLNLGVVENTLGNLREARARYLESVSAGIRSGSPEHAMRAYNNLGIVCTHLEEWLEAQLHLDRGIEIAERLGDTTTLALLHANRTKPLIHLGELERAAREADTAEACARQVGHHSCIAYVGCYRGMIAMAEGRLADAERHLEEALDLATQHDFDLCRAEILEQLALLRHRQGHGEEAFRTLEQAFDAFFAVGAKRNVSRVAALLEDWRPEVQQRVRIGGSW